MAGLCHALSIPLQLFGVRSLDVQSARLAGAVGNFFPVAAEMSSRPRGYPDHVFSFLFRGVYLRGRQRS